MAACRPVGPVPGLVKLAGRRRVVLILVQSPENDLAQADDLSPRVKPRGVTGWLWRWCATRVSFERICPDRVLHEALTARADPLHLALVFGPVLHLTQPLTG